MSYTHYSRCVSSVVGSIPLRPVCKILSILTSLLRVYTHTPLLPSGVDGLSSFLPALHSSEGATLTNSRGAFSESLAEHVIASALYFNKQARFR